MMSFFFSVVVLQVLLLLPLVQLAESLASGAPESEVSVVIATIGQSVVFPCNISLDEPLNPTSTRIYWQGRKEHRMKDLYPEVLHAYNKGEEELDKQHPSYRSRTRIFKDLIPDGVLSLLITEVKAEDDKTRFDVILQGNPVQTICQTTLRATARFQKPKVNVSCVEKGVGELELVCSSHGGFPKPTVSWTGSNSTTRPVTTVTDDKSSLLYSVHSVLRVNVSEGGDATVTCTVSNPTLAEHLRTSVTLSQRCPDLFTPDVDVNSLPVAIVVVIVVVIFLAVACVTTLYFCRSRLRCVCHRADQVI